MSKDYMTDGKASWITYENPDGATPVDTVNPWESPWNQDTQMAAIVDAGGVAIFRRVFNVNQVTNARIDATALGIFDLWCNGRRVGRIENGETVYDELKPGWTDFNKRVLYYSYDLTPYLREGENILLAAVAPGWYHGRIAIRSYGETHVSFLAAIHLLDKNGDRTIYTDKDWQAAWGGPVRAADIWDGERYDAAQPSYAALSAGEAALAWDAPVTERYDHLFVTPHIGPTVMVRPHLTRTPLTVTIYRGTEDNGTDYGRIHVVRTSENKNAFTLKRGESAVIDLGQDMVGWPTFTVKGPKGTDVLLRVGEMLNDSGSKERGNDNAEGSVYSINYRSAKAKLHYALKGDVNGEAYRPTFSFWGFRYCEITATEDVSFEDFACLVVGSATRETGSIETSHKDVNRLISNIMWGQRGNYLSVPTDCPQRDERLGWTGDTQAFCGTAAYNAVVNGFFHKWLQDMRDSQHETGMYPDVAPYVRVIDFGGTAWADAGIIVPYTMWKMYNDTAIIEEHFESMERYMDWIEASGGNGAAYRYGDWLAYVGTDIPYIALAYYAQNAAYMSAMARAIGKDARADYYADLRVNIGKKFTERFCDEAGNLKNEPNLNSQTAYLLALKVGLLAEANRPTAVAALKQNIIDNGYMLSTGFVGSCILNEILAEFGENDLAYSLLLQTGNPSWLYSVHQGATTIWERWNSYTLATGFGDVGMNSFNHYAYGAVQEWMYRHVAGIETTEDAPGFAHPILQPKPDTRKPGEIPAGQEKITWVKASFDSPVGMITSAWDYTDGFVYDATVPVQSTLHLPVLTDKDTFTVNDKTHRFDAYKTTPDGRAVIIPLAAGTYHITE